MAEEISPKEQSEAVWKRGWFVGGLGAGALLLLGVLLGVTLKNSTAATAGETTVITPSTALSTKSTDPVPDTTTQSTTSMTATTTTTTTVSGVGWDSTEAAVASMIACGYLAECEVEWPADEAPKMPESIRGYDREGPTERLDYRVLGDGSTAKSPLFPYLLGDCASQIWTARWRSVTGERLSAAVIPGTPETPFDEPWNPDWGELPAPSAAGFLAGFGCTQPAWTFTDSDPEYVIVADYVVEWQIWWATP